MTDGRSKLTPSPAIQIGGSVIVSGVRLWYIVLCERPRRPSKVHKTRSSSPTNRTTDLYIPYLGGQG